MAQRPSIIKLALIIVECISAITATGAGQFNLVATSLSS
jgi:hypothetical protein